MRAAVDDTFNTAVSQLLEEPSFWGIAVVGAIFIYFWRRDVSNPQRNASSAVLSGAVESSASVYSMAKEALETSRACERRFNALFEYTRTLQSELIKHGHAVPPMPEDALD